MNTQILEEAAEWLVGLREEAADAPARAQFAAWLCRSPEHVRAYLELSSIWADARDVDARATLDTQTLITRARAAHRVVALDDALLANGQPRAVSPVVGHKTTSKYASMIRRGALAASVALVCVTAAVAWWQIYRFPVYETETGEQRSITLADGSIVDLNSRSRIRIRYSPAERGVELLEGQGLFRVAKDRGRPFVVQSDHVRVRAVGTQFDVYRKLSGTVVTVLEGKVEVRSESSGAAFGVETQGPPTTYDARASSTLAAAVELTAGQQVRAAAEGIAPPRPANLGVATAWTQRQVVFDSAPLSEVVQEFNRYNFRQLVIRDVALENVLISGVFSSSDTVSLLRFLRDQPDLSIMETEREIRIARRE